jgi:hypothetical protein
VTRRIRMGSLRQPTEVVNGGGEASHANKLISRDVIFT